MLILRNVYVVYVKEYYFPRVLGIIIGMFIIGKCNLALELKGAPKASMLPRTGDTPPH